MFNRKIEARSQAIMAVAVQPLLNNEHPISFGTPISPDLLELYRLFLQEELLASLIADHEEADAPTKKVDKLTILEVVRVAKRLAAANLPTILVSTDEMLDIAHIYSLDNPDIEITPNAAAWWTSYNLREILVSVSATENSAWTARFIAALAYFSNLPTPGV